MFGIRGNLQLIHFFKINLEYIKKFKKNLYISQEYILC